MTPDTDIVTRLRHWADRYSWHSVSDELLEAAGEIERLRGENAAAWVLAEEASAHPLVNGLPGHSDMPCDFVERQAGFAQ